VGHCADVGLGGFLLQGGMGWNTRGRGWAAQHVEAIDIVTAAGDLVHADASAHWRTPVGRAWSRPGVPRCGHPVPPENLCYAEAASNHLRPARGPGGAGAALGYDRAT
jgi:hypothetical protein